MVAPHEVPRHGTDNAPNGHQVKQEVILSRKRIGLGSFVAATLTSVILIAPAAGTQEKPAGATAKLSSTSFCPDGSFCVYAGKNYTGRRLKLNSPPGVLSTELFQKMNNKVSSVKNRWKNASFLYEHKDGGGQPFCLDPGAKVPDLSAFFDEFNNDASSSRRSTTPFCGP